MHKERVEKERNGKLITLLICILSVIFTIAVGTFAFFKTNLKINGFANVKIELIFDKLNAEGLTKYRNTLLDSKGNKIVLSGDEAAHTGDYEWGHKGNPYVISAKNHILNLSTLQNIGYFNEKFIKSNYEADGVTLKARNTALYNDGYNVPYFYISTPQATPVCVDVSKETIASVGNDSYPFIGIISGANDANAPTTLTGAAQGKKSKTSAIYGLTINGKGEQIDIGFFGRISLLGTPPPTTEGEQGGGAQPDQGSGSGDQQTGKFDGFVSGITDVLFADVKIVVRDTIWDKISQFFQNHFFYHGDPKDPASDPHETHHIGIVAGHVEYAKAKNISIYYSSNSIKAIDIQDPAQVNGSFANYASATGYFGFLNNLNPMIDENGQVAPESGLSNNNVGYGMGGGGGLLSGNSPGYIRADEMYELYNYYAGDTEPIDQERPLRIIKAQKAEANADGTHDPLTTMTGNLTSSNHYFTDGVFTFALSSGQDGLPQDSDKYDTIENIWKKDEKGKTTIDNIKLSDTWDVGQEGEQQRFYKYLEPITDITKLNEMINQNKKFYIGTHITGTQNSGFKYIDLSFKQTDIGTKIKAQSSGGNIQYSTEQNKEHQLVLSYTKEETRTADEKFLLKVVNNGNDYTFQNAQNKKLKLGVRDSVIFAALICSSGGNSNHYNFELTYSDTPGKEGWIFYNRNIDVNIRFSGSEFDVKFLNIGGDPGVAVPIQIYADMGNAADPVNENPYQFVALNNSDGSAPLSFMADGYVLSPNEQYKRGTKQNTTYNLQSLAELGWHDRNGTVLWSPESGTTTIKRMFDIKQAVQWGLALDIGGIGLGFGSKGGIVKAPVGSKEAYVPTGALAFRINKLPATGDAKIRIIVKVPSTNETGALGLNGRTGKENEDYFVGIWKGKDRTGSFIQASTFDVENAYAKVEMPRSQRLIRISDGGQFGNITKAEAENEAISVSYGGKTYKTYLQGGSYLLAYQFTVTEPGLYLLAASNSAMQIAYCAADGVASSWRDGTGSANFGNVDFVYDNGTDVLLVTDYDNRPLNGNTPEPENPSLYYYDSNVMISFDTLKAHKDGKGVNNEVICIYRHSGAPPGQGGGPQTTLSVYVTSPDKYVLCKEIQKLHDIIDLKYNGVAAP